MEIRMISSAQFEAIITHKSCAAALKISSKSEVCGKDQPGCADSLENHITKPSLISTQDFP